MYKTLQVILMCSYSYLKEDVEGVKNSSDAED